MMKWFKIVGEKCITTYTEDSGKYYRQYSIWWNTGGYFVPQARKRCTRKEFERMLEAHRNDDGFQEG